MADLPPLPALRAFEAASRLGGFARAAAALNVSTSAISHQIRGLEASLGARLLDRSTGAGGVTLTAAGQRLLDATVPALAALQAACADIRGQPAPLTVCANAPFSAMWLARRLAEFSARHPDVPINAITHDQPDFQHHAIDLAIVHVKLDARRPGDVMLLREEVFPVCSPALYEFASTRVCLCRLLQEHHDNSPEIDWRNWATEFGLPADFPSKIVTYSSFTQVVGAAVGGAGLALGRLPLIEPELTSGRLVRLFPGMSRAASWCFVLRRAPGRQHPMVERLVEFLLAEVA
ncbi:LysR family transcriptional regulator [Acidisphaera sp. L21]|uniref:LysR family transcriptional regulator n=1 Tax=Acidisphaera sp. L21 TaxID=1641851 RepID=UPI00131C534F|nr:LysR family transcriptional regulator [Acidisphaera sp. L21]